MLVWIVVQGGGSSLALAALGLQSGPDSGRVDTVRCTPGAGFPMGEGMVCITEPGHQPIDLITSMFLHGSWMHLLGNMWFLWLFGNNVEDSMSRPRLVVFYLVVRPEAAALLAGRCRTRVGDPDGRRIRRNQRSDGRL